jgi:hypothetical protein
MLGRNRSGGHWQVLFVAKNRHSGLTYTQKRQLRTARRHGHRAAAKKPENIVYPLILNNLTKQPNPLAE